MKLKSQDRSKLEEKDIKVTISNDGLVKEKLITLKDIEDEFKNLEEFEGEA